MHSNLIATSSPVEMFVPAYKNENRLNSKSKSHDNNDPHPYDEQYNIFGVKYRIQILT